MELCVKKTWRPLNNFRLCRCYLVPGGFYLVRTYPVGCHRGIEFRTLHICTPILYVSYNIKYKYIIYVLSAQKIFRACKIFFFFFIRLNVFLCVPIIQLYGDNNVSWMWFDRNKRTKRNCSRGGDPSATHVRFYI